MTLLQQSRHAAQQLLWRLCARLGWLSLGCIGLGLGVLVYWQVQAHALQTQIHQMQAQLAAQPSPVSTSALMAQPTTKTSISETQANVLEAPAQAQHAEADLHKHLMSQLPPSTQLPRTLKQMAQLAIAQQLALNVGDYQWQAVASNASPVGLRAVEMRFVVHAPYVAIKRWVATVLNRFPLLALSSIEFKRNEITDPQLEATVVFTTYFKQAVDDASH